MQKILRFKPDSKKTFLGLSAGLITYLAVKNKNILTAFFRNPGSIGEIAPFSKYTSNELIKPLVQKFIEKRRFHAYSDYDTNEIIAEPLRILEVGAGEGHVTKYILKKLLQFLNYDIKQRTPKKAGATESENKDLSEEQNLSEISESKMDVGKENKKKTYSENKIIVEFDIVEMDKEFKKPLEELVNSFEFPDHIKINIHMVDYLDYDPKSIYGNHVIDREPDHRYDIIISTLPEQLFNYKLEEDILNKFLDDIKTGGNISRVRYLVRQKWLRTIMSEERLNNILYVGALQKNFELKNPTKQAIVYRNIPPVKIFHTTVN